MWMLLVIGAYLIGSVPFGLWVSRLLGGKDPRTGGSRNIGATNVARVSGTAAGVATLLLDVGKGALPTFLACQWLSPWQTGAVGLAAFLGHVFPVYLRFKGGKGVAVAVGVYLALMPLACAGMLIVFLVGTKLSGHVSVGSLAGSLSAPLWMYLAGGHLSWVAVCLVMAWFIMWRHKENIIRLREGREHRRPGL